MIQVGQGVPKTCQAQGHRTRSQAERLGWGGAATYLFYFQRGFELYSKHKNLPSAPEIIEFCFLDVVGKDKRLQ